MNRITRGRQKRGGLPCIRGLRVTVVDVLRMVADTHSTSTPLDAWEELSTEDVAAAIHYASRLVELADEGLLDRALRSDDDGRAPRDP